MNKKRGRVKMSDSSGVFVKTSALRMSPAMLQDLRVIAACENKHANDVIREFLKIGIEQYNRKDESETQTNK